MTNASQEIILRSLVFAGAYATHTFNGQTGPEICRWLLDTFPDTIWKRVGAGRVYGVPYEHWWKALRWTFDNKGTLEELTFKAALEENDLLERMGGLQGIGQLYFAASNGWLYLSDMSVFRGHVDRVLEAAKR